MIRSGLLLIGLTGCVGLQPSYVLADRQTYEAVAPEYRRYVLKDEDLDPAQRKRRVRTLDSWEARLARAEAAAHE